MRSVLPAVALCICVGTPLGAEASVLINEIAWMGSASNANAEWIELVNTGSETVSLAGWTLTSSTGSPSISLSGSISGNGFYLLTRTSTSIIPGVTGDQAYTGALSNSGTTLTLKDTTSSVDVVDGGTGWSLGGDNTTKHTAQRIGTTWHTASPTPRADNVVSTNDTEDDEDVEVEEENATSTPIVTVGGSSPTSGVGTFAFPKLYIVVGPSRIVPLYAQTPFRAFVYDEQGDERTNVRVSWSFGDGVRKSGYNTSYTYRAPGKYLVVVRAEHKHTSAVRTFTVDVTPARVRITAADTNGIEIENEDTNMLDISHWYLTSSGRRFTLPEDTALLPQQRTTFSSEVTRLVEVEGTTRLHFPSGKVAAEYGVLASTTPETLPEPENEEVSTAPGLAPPTRSRTLSVEDLATFLFLGFAERPRLSLF